MIKGKSLLIVEDEIEFGDLLKEALSPWVARVYQAGNGLEAKDILLSEKIDIVLSDVQMPKMDGVALLKFARGLKDPPLFVLFTGYAPGTEDFKSLGADDVLAKPIDLNELTQRLDALMAGGIVSR